MFLEIKLVLLVDNQITHVLSCQTIPEKELIVSWKALHSRMQGPTAADCSYNLTAVVWR